MDSDSPPPEEGSQLRVEVDLSPLGATFEPHHDKNHPSASEKPPPPIHKPQSKTTSIDMDTRPSTESDAVAADPEAHPESSLQESTPPLAAVHASGGGVETSEDGVVSFPFPSQEVGSSATKLINSQDQGTTPTPVSLNNHTDLCADDSSARSTSNCTNSLDSHSANTYASADANFNTNANANATAHANDSGPTFPTTVRDANTSEPTNFSALGHATNFEPPSTTTPPQRRRGHRAQSSVWRWLTRDENPHKTTVSVCMHCASRVPHHHKSEKARAHLKRCLAFHEHLAVIKDPPKWLEDDSTAGTKAMNTSNGANTLHESRVRLASQTTHNSPSSGSATKRPKSATPTPATTTVTAWSALQPNPNAVADALAMYMYTTGVPSRHMDDPHLRRAFQLSLPPTLSLCLSAQDLHGSLLDRAFASVQSELLRMTQTAGAVNTVCINSWYATQELRHSKNNESLYVVGTSTSSLYVDSTPVVSRETRELSHDLYDALSRTLSLCGDNIHGVVTDNSHADQLVWAKYKPIFPSKFFHGCASHGLHLFVSQIFETCDASSQPDDTAGDATPIPFGDLRQLVADCRELVQFISESASDKLKEQVAQKLSEAGLQRLSMPMAGQWSRLKAGLESILAALPILQGAIAAGACVSSGNANASDRFSRVKDFVNKVENESLVFKAVALVDPLDALMKRLTVDAGVPISEVFYWFAKQLPVALSRVPGLTDAESAYLLRLNQNRFNAMYGDSHGMAYLLDPRYVGEGLSADVRKNIEDLVFVTPLCDSVSGSDAEEQKIAIAQQLTEYVIDATQEKTNNSFRYSILIKNKKTVLQYWLSDGLRWPLLQRLAVRLFSLAASTLPMVQRVLDVPLQLPQEELSSATSKKIKFIQLNQSLLAQGKSTAGE